MNKLSDSLATDTLYPNVPNHLEAKSSANEDRKDYFSIRNGREYAGVHLIFDFWGATGIDSIESVEDALKESVEEARATLLHIHLHHFTPNNGISGVAVLSESHICVHTWPERNYAAFDVFMCGDADPLKTLPVLKERFTPSYIQIREHLRGMPEAK